VGVGEIKKKLNAPCSLEREPLAGPTALGDLYKCSTRSFNWIV